MLTTNAARKGPAPAKARGGKKGLPRTGRVYFEGDAEAIEQLAEKARERWADLRVPNESPREWLGRIVEVFGGRIRVAEDCNETPNGSIIIRGPNDFDVYLSPYTSPLRDTFTLAHEMGHYVMHFEPTERDENAPALVFQRYGANIYEWQANRFAGALLMPQNDFKRYWHEMSCYPPLDRERRVAAHFGVSREAARVRAEVLDLDVEQMGADG